MKDIVKSEIYKILKCDFILEKPRSKSLAHYASPIAFSLAKELKKSPMKIADEFIRKFKDNDVFDVFSVNGYINFKLKPKFLNSMSDLALNLGKKFGTKEPDGDDLFIEYISANPTGTLHIGHVRGAVYGDSLARIGKHIGKKIFTEYYINDSGAQIDLLGLSIKLRAKEILFNETVEYPEKYYRDYIDEVAKLAFAKFGRDIFYNDDRSLELANFGKDFMINLIKKDLANVHIFIDSWISEKSLYNDLEPTIKHLEKSGQMYEKDGAVYISSAKFGDDNDRVVIRSDGRPTYLAGDIVYHNAKFKQDYKNYMNIWGADHHGYIARIKAAINFLGYDENRLEIVLMQMVSLLKDGLPYKISKRSGTSVLISDIVSEIGSDALRFIFISKANTSSLEFDIDELKKEDSSNPVFYINYAHARINQIFAKSNKSIADVKSADLSNLDENAMNLLFEALIFPEILEDAFNQRALHKIPDYLKHLSSSFHKFYNENRVLGSQNEDELLKLFYIVGLSIRVGFELIGIKAKDRMEH